MVHFVVKNWVIIMASAIIALNIIAIIALVLARRAMESVFSSRSSRTDACLAASQEEAKA